MKIDDQNPDDLKNIDSKYYWSLVEFKNEMSEKIADIRRSFRQDALKFLNDSNGESVEVKLNHWIEWADSKDTLQYVEAFLTTGTTINFEGKVKTAQKQIADILTIADAKRSQVITECIQAKKDRIAALAHHAKMSQKTRGAQTAANVWIEFVQNGANKPFSVNDYSQIIRQSGVTGIRYEDIPWPPNGRVLKTKEAISFHPHYYKKDKFVQTDFDRIFRKAEAIFKMAEHPERSEGLNDHDEKNNGT